MKIGILVLCCCSSMVVAQETTQEYIDPARPPAPVQSLSSPSTYTCDQTRNEVLLDVLKALADEDSVDNEVKFEQANNLNERAIYTRRICVIQRLAKKRKKDCQ